jgi:hypothetical protein
MTAIAQASTPTLACVVGVTDEGCNGKAVVFLVAIAVSKGFKSNIR